jgi:hypothetical protein
MKFRQLVRIIDNRSHSHIFIFWRDLQAPSAPFSGWNFKSDHSKTSFKLELVME